MKTIYISMFILLNSSLGWCQLEEGKIKAGLIYKFIGSIEWPDNAIHENLKIGIHTIDTLLIEELDLYCRSSFLKGVPNQVVLLSTNDSYDNLHVVYIDEDHDKYILNASEQVKNKPVLIITYNSDEPILTMINIVKQKRDKTLSYTVNKEKIESVGLNYSPELLLHGGSVSDLKELYVETSVKLNKKAIQLDSLSREINDMIRQSNFYKEEMKRSQGKIDSIKGSVANKELEVKSLNQLISNKDENLAALGKELQYQLIQKNKLANELSKQLDSIAQAETDLMLLDKELKSLNVLIERNQQTLNRQKVKIESQNKVLLVSALAGIGLIITIFSIAFALRAKRQLANKLKFLVDKKTHDLNVSRQYYKGLFDNSPVAICEFDLSGLMEFVQNKLNNNTGIESLTDDLVMEAVKKIKVKDINNETAKLFNVASKEEFIEHYISFFTDKSIIGLRTVIQQMLSGAKNFEFEMIRENKNNHEIHLIESLVVLPEDEGFFSKVLVSMLDITELKLYEQELVKHRDHLEDLVKERAQEIIQLNDDLFNANEELHSKNDDLSMKNVQLKKQQEEISDLNKGLVEANRQLEDQKEELINTISQLNETQKQLIESEKMASLGMLTAGVAHEINNPVNFISGGNQAIEMMLNELWDNLSINNGKGSKLTVQELNKKYNFSNLKSNLTEIIESINTGVYRINEIVKSLQNYSQRDTDRYEMVTIGNEIESALTILQSKYIDRIEIEKHLENVPEIKSSSVKLNQVIVNILSNAFDAIEAKGKVGIKASSTGDKAIQVSFTDNGKGMSEEELSSVFDPFFTTKEPGKGTGLGMYLSYGIVEQLKGKITIDSAKGSGTTVILELPVAL